MVLIWHTHPTIVYVFLFRTFTNNNKYLEIMKRLFTKEDLTIVKKGNSYNLLVDNKYKLKGFRKESDVIKQFNDNTWYWLNIANSAYFSIKMDVVDKKCTEIIIYT